MDGSNGSSGSIAPAPFVTKTYEMVEDPLTNSVVGWSHNGHSFIVWNPIDFAIDLLPKYFKHNNFSSFVRQLNTYGFRKIDPEQWEFANDDFLRGQKHLLKNIYRRKLVYSHSTRSSSVVSSGNQERQEFEEEIERMKQENSLLGSELEKYKLEKHEFVSEIGTLGQSVKAIYHRQRQLMMFLAQLLQKPGVASSGMPRLDNKLKRRRLVISGPLYGEANKGEISQLVTREDQETPHTSFPQSDLDLIDELESSIKFWENFMLGIRDASAEDTLDFGLLPESENATSTENVAIIVGDNDMNSPPCFSASPDSSSSSREIVSSPVLADSINTDDTPATSSLCFSTESWQNSSDIDMDTSPAIIMDADAAKDQLVGKQSAPVGTNDVFWQQFFIDTPSSTDTHEVASERRGTGAKKTESRFLDFGRHWRDRYYLNNLPKELGHLTP